MPHQTPSSIDILNHNRSAWNRQAEQQCEWSRPVSAHTIAAARAGNWQARLTSGDMPPSWLGDVRGKKILCLAAAGGQQAPILAAAGAEVTVFDLSEQQLAMDRMVAERENLPLTIIQGDMRDLSVLADSCFDIVFHPISNLYVPDIRPVWRECFRVLQPGGKLLASFYNPIVFVGERSPEDAEQGVIRPRFTLPYSELEHLSKIDLAGKLERGEAFVFGHSLSDQIAGQLAAGFVLTGFQEDMQPVARFVIDRYLPTFIATCAVKL
jgi:2-polyprenyl-3-methyl-5-hydroxy-6-metoxy-1,4-benzoquinol methylase